MKKKQWLKSVVILVVLLAVLTAAGGVLAHGGAHRDSSDVYWWWGDHAGTSTIVRTQHGISGTYSSSLSNPVGSAEGLAVTVWLVIFNNPSACATIPCGEPDLFVPDVMPDALYGAGNIVGGSERAMFGFHLNKGDNSGSIADLFGMPTDSDGEPFGLKYPATAEIHYVIRTHGPMNPMYLPAQIDSYGGGCLDNAPFGYPPPASAGDLKLGDGQCQDIQFAINR